MRIMRSILCVICCFALLSPLAAAESAEGWTCPACEREDNHGNFCVNCGEPKPAPTPQPGNGAWDCPACGNAGNTGNFCGECGQPRPVVSAEWTCPACGEEGNKGKYCINCGQPRPDSDVSPVKAPAVPEPVVTPPPAGEAAGPLPTIYEGALLTPWITAKVNVTPTPQPTATPTPRPTNTPRPTDTPRPTLSPNHKSSIKATIYSSPRSRRISNESVTNLKSFSVKTMAKNKGIYEYGLYFKFTPKASEAGNVISRFDFVVTGPYGDIVYQDGFYQIMRLQRNHYGAIKFFNLQGMFDEQARKYGSVPTGTYTLDVYFDEAWSGKTTFKVNK